MRLPGSFRDPSGFVFRRNGSIYRQVNKSFQTEYDQFIVSGLYDRLVRGGYLVSHRDVQLEPAEPEVAYKVLQPEIIDFTSYPYEWCFSQLKDGALLTLQIQRLALETGQVLKDASAYNVQFKDGKPIWIDTLSFEPWVQGEPWIAYRQFCQHFLAPLSLAAYRDIRIDRLLRVHLDGIPLDLASKLLPFRTRLRLRLLTHLHLHARAQARYNDGQLPQGSAGRQMSLAAMNGLIDDLEAAIRSLEWDPSQSAWSAYSHSHNYSASALGEKRRLVEEFLGLAGPRSVWDLGANTGEFSRLATERGVHTVAFDFDPGAVDENYRTTQRRGDKRMLPLLMDLTNPSPSLGWGLAERESLIDRGPADLVMTLALIHHLAIANNVPLLMISDFFSELGEWLLVEFVPKDDLQVQRLLRSRRDIFTDYNLPAFLAAFERHFSIIRHEPVGDSGRTLYLMHSKTA